MDDLRWQNWIVLVLGFYIGVTPWLFGLLFAYADLPVSLIVAQCLAGGLVATVAYLGLLFPEVWHEASKVLLGFWLIVSPWVIGFSALGALSYNNILCGYLAVLLGGLALVSRHPGGGNRSF